MTGEHLTELWNQGLACDRSGARTMMITTKDLLDLCEAAYRGRAAMRTFGDDLYCENCKSETAYKMADALLGRSAD